MSHRRVKKRTGVLAAAGAAAIAAAAIWLPSANASHDDPPGPQTFTAGTAARTGAALADTLGDRTAGWYYDGHTKRLVVNVLDDRTADRVRAEGAEARTVKNSLAELRTVTSTLSATAAVPGTAWSVDPRTNTVRVIADRTVGSAGMATLARAEQSMDGKVTVERSAGEFRPFDRRGDEGDGRERGRAGGREDRDGNDRESPGDDGSTDDGSTGNGNNSGGTGNGGTGSGSGSGNDSDNNGGGTGNDGTGSGSSTGNDGAGSGNDSDNNGGGTGNGGTGSGTGNDGTGSGNDSDNNSGGAAVGPDGGDAIFGGGFRCSLGFNVQVGGAPAFLTAGHCGDGSDTWAADPAGGQPLGTVIVSEFPVSDFALVRYDDAGLVPPGTVDLQDGTSQEINRVVEAAVGMEVQRSGSTTGLSGGTVTGLDATVNYGNGDIVNGLIQTDVCAEPGDSGGPLFSGDAAVGLTSGGSGDCVQGGVTFFQPVTTALRATGAELPGAAGNGGTGGAGSAGIDDAAAGDGAVRGDPVMDRDADSRARRPSVG